MVEIVVAAPEVGDIRRIGRLRVRVEPRLRQRSRQMLSDVGEEVEGARVSRRREAISGVEVESVAPLI